MAPPPRTKQFTVDVPDEHAEWFEPFLSQLNAFALSTTTGFQASLTRAQNFASQRYTLDLETGAVVSDSFPVVFDCTLSTQPEYVRVTQVRVLTTGADSPEAVTCSHWELVSGNQIKIYKITGLAVNTKYQILFTIT